MNKVFLIGNLTRDPEPSETNNNISMCRFTIAVNRGYGDSKDTDYYNCIAWRGTADNVAKYCQKGSKVAVVGDITIRNYEDREGTARTSVDVSATEVEFLTPKGNKGENSSYSPAKKKPTLQEFDDDDTDAPF